MLKSTRMASCPLVVNPARASSQVGHGWRSHIVFELTPHGKEQLLLVSDGSAIFWHPGQLGKLFN